MYNSNEMYDLGLAFLNSGEINFQEGAIKNRAELQNVAGIVNLAFACELFIKCLLNTVGKEKKVHILDDLWQEYKGTCVENASKIEALVMDRLVTDFSFEELLRDDSNVFFNYRYFYDPNCLNEITTIH